MTAQTLVRDNIRRAIPGADVLLTPTAGGYSLTVRSDRLAPMGPADRQAEVYAALGRVPLDLLARITEIRCPSPAA